MKRFLSLILVIVLSLSVLAFTGCGDKVYPEDYESIVLDEEKPVDSITLLYSEGTLSSNTFFPVDVTDKAVIADILTLLKDAEDGFKEITNEDVLTLSDANICISVKSGGSYVARYFVYDTGYIYSLSGYVVNKNYQSLDKTSYADLFDIYVRLGGKH